MVMQQTTSATAFVNELTAGTLGREHVPVLDDLQVGHVRHIENLANQLRGDWMHMTADDPFQEGLDALRYQLAYMAYALGLAHVNRLPSAPAVFQTTFEKLIEKIMHPEAWFYWRDTSQGAWFLEPETKAKQLERWDPVREDNIMYSAYLQSMALMYDFLFGDHRYAEEGALTLSIDPHVWKAKEGPFVWDQNSLNDTIYWQMVQNGYLGVACEPNLIFPICNQPAILGFRLHDIINGGAVAEEVTAGWLKAWEDFGGLIGRNGHYNSMIFHDSNTVIGGKAMSSNGWLGALLHMWNPELVAEHYRYQMDKNLRPGSDGTISVKGGLSTRGMDGTVVPSTMATPELGWGCAWASEMGDTETLEGLLAHADRYMSPTWDRGGLFYPRNDDSLDADGNRIRMDRTTGNALIGYSRLNVPDGLWKMYNEPWDESHHREPKLSRVSDTVDVRTGWYDRDAAVLVLRVTPRADRPGDALLDVANVFGRGEWAVSGGSGHPIASGDGADVRSTGSSPFTATRVDGALRIAGPAMDEGTTFVVSFASPELVG
jgi:hypothetical protein